MFHDDWEVYGDGSGNPDKLMFDPAKKNLDICDSYNVKYTFFAEFGQQLAMLNSPVSNHRKWANEWERILKDAVSRGHDVQLHFHPQWIDAPFEKGKWNLNFNKWSLASLNQQEIFLNLKKGKDYLENLLKPVSRKYKIVAFRSGGWMNQPSNNIYKALIDLDIKAEVSVRPGIIRNMGEIGKIDFSSAPIDKYYWNANKDDFSKECNKGKIVEIPTYSKEIKSSLPVYLIQKRPSTALYYLNIFLRNYFYPSSNKAPSILGENNKNHIYCNFGLLHYLNLIDIVENILREVNMQNKLNIPLIMLAHSKSFRSHKNFEKLLEKLNNYEQIEYTSTQDMVLKIMNSQN